MSLACTHCNNKDISVEILTYDYETDDYLFPPVTITTLNDINRLEGRATSLVGGTKATINYETGMMSWQQAGWRVAFSAIEINNVLIPEDFDSLAMVAIYYNIEQAMLYFESIEMPDDLLVKMNTYYWPKLTIIEKDGEKTEMVDNAFYLHIDENDRGFYVFPYKDFQWIPLSMNIGIMIHEYSHSVYDVLVNDPNRTKMFDSSAINFLYGINEGWADYSAVSATRDPNYMAHSFPEDIFVNSCNSSVNKELVRNASDVIVYDNAIDNDARISRVDEFCPYDIGAFIASIMYEIARKIDNPNCFNGDGSIPSKESLKIVALAFYNSLQIIGKKTSANFEIWDLFSVFVNVIDELGYSAEACNALNQRYAIHVAKVKGC